MRFGLLPPEVYAVGIATKPEAAYTFAEATKRLDLPEPALVSGRRRSVRMRPAGWLGMREEPQATR